VTQQGTITNWTSPGTKIEWGGFISKPGTLHAVATVSLHSGDSATYELKVGNSKYPSTAVGLGDSTTIDFGNIQILNAGWQTFWLQGITGTGSEFGTLKSLALEGDPVKDAKFNLKERRNAASVHLSYPAPDDPEWFYNEVTATEDPVATYYMACGFSRGYFGMQVNGPQERRVIFSIWDSGNEAVDRSKVTPANQVQLLAKGAGVYASGFGNEGTGGHSHLVYPWKTHEPQKFLVHAQANGNATIYTAYFRSKSDIDWRLIAKFSAPHDGKLLRGLYSFVEDFDGENGNLKRKALYGPAWIYSASKGWKRVTTARFTHDATGGKDRFDYDFGIEKGRFYLQNGGFEGSSPQTGATVQLPTRSSLPPNIEFAKLETLGK
jgi:hypothetical protein